MTFVLKLLNIHSETASHAFRIINYNPIAKILPVTFKFYYLSLLVKLQ
jgi:hypothetical protein